MASPLHFLAWWGFEFDLLLGGCPKLLPSNLELGFEIKILVVGYSDLFLHLSFDSIIKRCK